MVEIVGKSYKQIQVREDIDQLEFLKATEEAWEYLSGSYKIWNNSKKNLDGTFGGYDMGPSWPNHKEFGGILSLKNGYQIVGINHVRKGNWGLHIDNLFYTNIHFLSTDHSEAAVEKFGLFNGNTNGVFHMDLAWHSEYDKMVEITQFEGIGFSFCIIRDDGVIVTMYSEQIARNIGINVPTWDLRWSSISIPA